LEKSVIVVISEPKNGYKKSDGTIVEPRILTWKCVFNNNSKGVITKFFNRGSYVVVKGDIVPYAMDKGEVVDGYSVLGQSINYGALPRNLRTETRAIKDSQTHSQGMPDVRTYRQPDFDFGESN